MASPSSLSSFSSVSEPAASVGSLPSTTVSVPVSVPPEMLTIERPGAGGVNAEVQGQGDGSSEGRNSNSDSSATRAAPAAPAAVPAVDGTGDRDGTVNGRGMSKDETCAICLTGYVGHEELRVLIPCEHAFHRRCGVGTREKWSRTLCYVGCWADRSQTLFPTALSLTSPHLGILPFLSDMKRNSSNTLNPLPKQAVSKRGGTL